MALHVHIRMTLQSSTKNYTKQEAQLSLR